MVICLLALVFCAASIFRSTSTGPEYSYADIRALFQWEKGIIAD